MKKIIPGLMERKKCYQYHPKLEFDDIFKDPSTNVVSGKPEKIIQVVTGKIGSFDHSITKRTERSAIH
jgi:hypothetical protein